MADTAQTPSADAEALGRRVIAVIAKAKELDPREISLDSTFEELGFDSLDSFDVVYDLEEEFDILIPDEVAHQIKTVREVTDRLGELLSGGEGGD